MNITTLPELDCIPYNSLKFSYAEYLYRNLQETCGSQRPRGYPDISMVNRVDEIELRLATSIDYGLNDYLLS